MTLLLDARALSLDLKLKPTDLQLRAGELAALIGPNGSGKTSLLRALAGIERSNGNVRISGEDLSGLSIARRAYLVTYLPASRDLAWPVSSGDVIALGLPRPDPDRIDELVQLLELQSIITRRADRLSTGERARVLFARAIAPKPRVLLLDEPLSNLDPYWVLRFLEIMRAEVDQGACALVALHDIERVTAFDRALLIGGGELRSELPPEKMLRSPDLSDAFGIERTGQEWRIKPKADPRSSP